MASASCSARPSSGDSALPRPKKAPKPFRKHSRQRGSLLSGIPHLFAEQAVEAAVGGELGMEGGQPDTAGAKEDRTLLHRGHHLHGVLQWLQKGGPDEHTRKRVR